MFITALAYEQFESTLPHPSPIVAIIDVRHQTFVDEVVFRASSELRVIHRVEGMDQFSIWYSTQLIQLVTTRRGCRNLKL